MPIDIPLPTPQQPETLDILGSLYAQKMNHANLEKLKAAITGQNLSNQESQIKMPFVAHRQQADIDKIRALMQKAQIESHYIPTKYNQAGQRLGIQQGNLDLNKQRFSPEQLAGLLKYRNALSAAKEQGNLPVDTHGIPIQQGSGGQPTNIPSPQQTTPGIQGGTLPNMNQAPPNSPSGINPGNANNNPSNPEGYWIPSNIGRSAKGDAHQFYNPITHETLVPFTPKQRDKVLTEQSTIDDVIPQIKKLIEYGKKAYLGAPSTLINKLVDPNNNADYGSTLSYVKDKMIGATALPKLKQVLNTLGDINRRFAGETAEHYENRANNLINTLQQTKLDANRYLRHGGYIIPSENNGDNNASMNLPKSHDPKEIKSWLKTASKEQRDAFAKTLG